MIYLLFKFKSVRDFDFRIFSLLALSDRIHMNDTESRFCVSVDSLLHLLRNVIGILNRRAVLDLDMKPGMDDIRPDVLGAQIMDAQTALTGQSLIRSRYLGPGATQQRPIANSLKPQA
jgi:hypothetical protein